MRAFGFCFPVLVAYFSLFHSRFLLAILKQVRYPCILRIAVLSFLQRMNIRLPCLTGESTVRVRFVLQRECSFGQQFFLTGEDPMFGSWEPSAAIPMDWSEGHIWTTEQVREKQGLPHEIFLFLVNLLCAETGYRD